MAKLKRKLWLLSLLIVVTLFLQDQQAIARAGVLRRDRETITSYDPLGETNKTFEVLIVGAIPTPYIFSLSTYEPVWDVAHAWLGGGECALQGHGDILCTGNINYLWITWRNVYRPEVKGQIMTDVSMASSPYHVDYTLDVYYPTNLELAETEIAPAIEEPGHTKWASNNILLFQTWTKYYDSRIKVALLPFVLK